MNQEKIGKFISKQRKAKNMTQEELASILGVTDKSVSRWENGKTMPDLSMIKDLSNELNCTIPELLNGRKMTQEELVNLRETIDNLIDYESNRQISNEKKFNKYNLIGIITLELALFQKNR